MGLDEHMALSYEKAAVLGELFGSTRGMTVYDPVECRIGTVADVILAANVFGWFTKEGFADLLADIDRFGTMAKLKRAEKMRYIAQANVVSNDYESMINMQRTGIPIEVALIALEHGLDTELARSVLSGAVKKVNAPYRGGGAFTSKSGATWRG